MTNPPDEDLALMSQGSFDHLCQQLGEDLWTENLNLEVAETDVSVTTHPPIADVVNCTSTNLSGYRPPNTTLTVYTAPSATSAHVSYTAPGTTDRHPAYTAPCMANPLALYTAPSVTISTPRTSSTVPNTPNVSDSGSLRPMPATLPLIRQTSTGFGVGRMLGVMAELHVNFSVDDGCLDLQIEIPQLSKQTKSVPWTYSEMLNKLYIQMQTPFQLNARISAKSSDISLPRGMFLRAVPMFTEKHQRDDPVRACFHHSNSCSTSGALHKNDPWMQAGKRYLPTTVDLDPRGHYTLITPWQPYTSNMEIDYQFICKNTCIGGPNRRRTSVAFVLESQSGEVLAKRMMEVKVSACPGRDRTNDEKAARKGDPAATVVKSESSRKRVHFKDVSSCSHPKKKFYLEMEDEDTYSLLSQLRDSIELSKQISPEMKQKYLSVSRHLSHAAITATTSQPVPISQQTGSWLTSTSTSPPLMPDSCSGEYNTNSEDTKVSEWLPSVGLGAYVDSFLNAGIVTLNQVANMGLKDFDKLQIGLPHVLSIMEKLANTLKADPLSQASQSESYGLYEVSRNQSQLSSSED